MVTSKSCAIQPGPRWLALAEGEIVEEIGVAVLKDSGGDRRHAMRKIGMLGLDVIGVEVGGVGLGADGGGELSSVSQRMPRAPRMRASLAKASLAKLAGGSGLVKQNDAVAEVEGFVIFPRWGFAPEVKGEEGEGGSGLGRCHRGLQGYEAEVELVLKATAVAIIAVQDELGLSQWLDEVERGVGRGIGTVSSQVAGRILMKWSAM